MSAPSGRWVYRKLLCRPPAGFYTVRTSARFHLMSAVDLRLKLTHLFTLILLLESRGKKEIDVALLSANWYARYSKGGDVGGSKWLSPLS
jgi:hypothetical protein